MIISKLKENLNEIYKNKDIIKDLNLNLIFFSI